MLFSVLLLSLLILSCGGGRESVPLVLSFRGAVSSPYFTAVEVRVSGEDFAPLLAKRTGTFYPGDRVEIEVRVPEGRERLFEATVYDNEGKPVYYGATTEDVGPDSKVVIELVESLSSVKGFISYRDGKEPLPDPAFYIANEDLYILKGPLRGGETYLTGSYILHKVRGGFYRYLYAYGAEEVELLREKERTYRVRTPPTEEVLHLTGSYEGYVRDGDTITVRSPDMLPGNLLVLSGIGNSINLLLGSSAGEEILFSHSTCTTGEEADCLALGITFEGIQPTGYGLWADYRGIPIRIDRGGFFWKGEDLSYSLEATGVLWDGGCSGSWSLTVPLPPDFTGTASLFLEPAVLAVEGGVRGFFRIEGEGLEVEGFCEGSDSVSFPVYEKVPEGSFFELISEGKRLGVQVGEGKVVVPDIDLEVKTAELRGDHIYFKFTRYGDLEECELKLKGKSLEVEVDRIPSHRSYLKIRLPQEVELKEEFGEGIYYRLTCFTAREDAYVSVEFPEERLLF